MLVASLRKYSYVNFEKIKKEKMFIEEEDLKC